MKDSTIKKTLCTSHAHQACRYPNDLYRNRYKSWLICCVFLIFIACQEAHIIQLETSDSLETPMTAPMPEEMKSGPQVLAEDEFESAEVGHTALRRLTFEQIKHSLQDVLGHDILIPEVAEPAVVQNGLIAIGASIASLSSRGVNSIEQMAYTVAEQAMDESHRQNIVSCTPQGNSDAACAEEVITQLGLKLWRRPLEKAEIEELLALFTQASETLDSFHAGLEFVIARFIQSPHFLFRTEMGVEDTQAESQRSFTQYELASRLSYFLWNTTPDDELLTAAAEGVLSSREGLLEHADRLLQSDRARIGLRAFYEDFLGLEELQKMRKDPDSFESYTGKVPQAAKEETLKLIEYIIFDLQADIREVMTSQFSFIDPILATIYQVPAPDPLDFAYIEHMPEQMRSGILTHVSFLALHSHAIDSSATLRGKAVRTTLLCQIIPVPPVDVDTSIPEPSAEQQTLRERVANHLTEPACAGCHALTDPIGLGLENFDALGSWRDLDHGAVIDATGELDGVAFEHPRQLGETIADHPSFLPCLLQKMSSYAIGRSMNTQEESWLDTMYERFETHDYQLIPMVRELIASPLFRYAGPPQ